MRMETLAHRLPASGLERAAAAFSHGALLLGMPFVLPLAILVLFPLMQPSDYVKQQSLQALVFHLLVTLIAGGLFALALVFGLFGVLEAVFMASPDGQLSAMPANWWLALLSGVASVVVLLWGGVMALVATVMALRGQPYNLPLVGGLGR